MRTLLKEFDGGGEAKGYRYRQIRVGDHAFLYEVLRGGVVRHYEAFRRKISDAHPKSKTQEPMEMYPKSKAFGVWAWTCMDLTSAKRRFDEINKPPKKKKQLKTEKQ